MRRIILRAFSNLPTANITTKHHYSTVQHFGSMASPSRKISERTALLAHSNRASTAFSSHQQARDARPSTIARPQPIRAATTSAIPLTSPSNATPSPVLSRPTITRSMTTTTSSSNPKPKEAARPSLLRRATDTLSSKIEPASPSSYARRNKPEPPTHWTDHAHREALVRIWDSTQRTKERSGHGYAISTRLMRTEGQMLQEYLELREGDVPLNLNWIEYVLGVCLRHPFCTLEGMGRREVLSGSGGARGNWGPF